MRTTILHPCVVLILLGCANVQAQGPKVWLVKDHLQIGLQADEVPGEGCPQLRGVFFGDANPSRGIETLFQKDDHVRKELRALASGLSLKPRKPIEHVQANGRVALVWEKLETKAHRRSTATKDHTFDSNTDRLVAVLAVLDSKAISVGKWLNRDDAWTLPLPAKWTIPWTKGGFGFPEDWERTQGVGPSLAGIIPISAGNFTGEQLGWDGFRGAVENRIGIWVRNNARDQVVVMIVYRYDKDTNPRCPTAYRYHAVSASGTLEVQVNGGIGTSMSGLNVVRDKGGVIVKRRKNAP